MSRGVLLHVFRTSPARLTSHDSTGLLKCRASQVDTTLCVAPLSSKAPRTEDPLSQEAELTPSPTTGEGLEAEAHAVTARTLGSAFGGGPVCRLLKAAVAPWRSRSSCLAVKPEAFARHWR